MKYSDNKCFAFCEPDWNVQMYTQNKAKMNYEVMHFLLDCNGVFLQESYFCFIDRKKKKPSVGPVIAQDKSALWVRLPFFIFFTHGFNTYGLCFWQLNSSMWEKCLSKWNICEWLVTTGNWGSCFSGYSKDLFMQLDMQIGCRNGNYIDVVHH